MTKTELNEKIKDCLDRYSYQLSGYAAGYSVQFEPNEAREICIKELESLHAEFGEEIIGKDEPDKNTKLFNGWPSDGNEIARNAMRKQQRSKVKELLGK